ncbi:hypothetical protein HPB47_012366 [Ixodes persulcatus]|uniref:Uncharacterized protein n=1 Tax=Ixodes persulcatus TaxID=34615 RepID=A0AC60NTP3_IXOPE|nr:hypothetical protein HPB47_012366 [Ixodes persulcatus]
MRTGPRLKPALPASAAAATDKAQQLGQSTAKLLPDHDGGAVERRLPPLPPSPPGQRQRRETLAAAQMAPSTDGRFGPSPPRERLAQEANGAQPVEASRRAATSPGTCSTRAHLHWPPRSQIRVLRNTSGHPRDPSQYGRHKGGAAVFRRRRRTTPQFAPREPSQTWRPYMSRIRWKQSTNSEARHLSPSGALIPTALDVPRRRDCELSGCRRP